MIEKVAEHLIDLELLPQKATILDLGCLGFIFTKEMRRLGHRVYPVDIQYFQDEFYYRVAITNYNGYGYVLPDRDPQAFRFVQQMTTAEKNGGYSMVMCETLEDFMRNNHVEYFDYIKCDVEGSETQIIASLTKPPSKQFEVEFHMHTGYPEDGVELMVNKLQSLGYKIASHEKTSQHGCGENYWSSLFIHENGI